MFNNNLLKKKLHIVKFKSLYSSHIKSGDFITFNLIDFNKTNIWKTNISGLLIGKSSNLLYIIRHLNKVSILYKINLNSLNLIHLNQASFIQFVNY